MFAFKPQTRAPYGARPQYPPQYHVRAPRFRDPAPSYPSQYNAPSPSNPQSRYVPKQPRVNPEQLRLVLLIERGLSVETGLSARGLSERGLSVETGSSARGLSERGLSVERCLSER
jgi:hypothetical protein